MQPETNFSMLDDVLHAGGCDVFFAGHVHTYQRFYPLRTSPYGPNATKPNNVPRDIDFDCASTEHGAEYSHSSNASGPMVANNTYTNPRYMTTIIAGSPGDPEVSPIALPDRNATSEKSMLCFGNITTPSLVSPMAVCRYNVR